MNSVSTPRFVSRLTRDTLALILAGGRGSRLKQLTLWRAKPAVPFGGKFRIIDFPLSNCMNSGIRRVGVLTQYKAHSLLQHIQRGWGFLRGEFGEFVELLPAQQRIQSSWYAGTADAIYQNLDIIRLHNPEYVLILAGDHIYKMDYGPMIAHHVEHGADMTVGCLEVDLDTARAFGVMTTDDEGRVLEFNEKPENPAPMPGSEDIALASMGIYVFNTRFLFEQLIKDADKPESSHDFGNDIVDAFWATNLELIGVTPELNLYDQDWPIWTYQEQMPPAKFVFDDEDRRGTAIDSMVSGGCVISGATVRHSLLFSNVKVNSYSQLNRAVVLPDAEIGRNCRIQNAVIDKGCQIPNDTIIGEDPAKDAERFHVSPGGVVLVTPEMLGQELHHVR
jgi:glucose-1-phosphate adenylyltransferase